MIIAVVGSRNYPNLDLVKRCVAGFPPGTVVISGGARGVDQTAAETARECGLDVYEYIPNWKEHGKMAGLVRNSVIVENADHVIAFWDGTSRGTLNTINKTAGAGKRLTIVRPDGEEEKPKAQPKPEIKSTPRTFQHLPLILIRQIRHGEKGGRAWASFEVRKRNGDCATVVFFGSVPPKDAEGEYIAVKARLKQHSPLTYYVNADAIIARETAVKSNNPDDKRHMSIVAAKHALRAAIDHAEREDADASRVFASHAADSLGDYLSLYEQMADSFEENDTVEIAGEYVYMPPEGLEHFDECHA